MQRYSYCFPNNCIILLLFTAIWYSLGEIEEAIEAFRASSEQGDRDIIALGRKIEASYELLGIYFRNSYSITYFKEYASKVRKTEKTILNPKGYSLASDLNPLMEQYLADRKALEERAKTYAGEVVRIIEICVVHITLEKTTKRILFGKVIRQGCPKSCNIFYKANICFLNVSLCKLFFIYQRNDLILSLSIILIIPK